MSNLQDLKDELINDPLTRGYSGMNDLDAAVSLLTKNRTIDKITMSASEIFEAIDTSEYAALVADDKSRVNVVLNLGDQITITPSSKARSFLLAAFTPGAGPNTRAALAAASVELISRSAEILGGDIPGIYGFRTAEEAVVAARAL